MAQVQPHKVSFSVKVDVVGAEGDSQKEARAAFWSALRRKPQYVSSDDLSDDEMETRLETYFGKELRSLLIAYTYEPYERLTRRRDLPNENLATAADLELSTLSHHLRSVLFIARIRSYSSLNFDVEIAGITSLSEIFGADFELFRMFLETYIPVAFQETFDHWKFGATADITFPPTFGQSFRSQATNGLSGETSAKTESKDLRGRAAWIWILSNTSLVVPVILALLVIYLQTKWLDEQRASLEQRTAQLQTREEANQRAFSDQHKQIADYMLEVARLLKPQPTKTSP